MGWTIYAYRRYKCHCTDMKVWDYSSVPEDRDELAAMMHVAARELLEKYKKKQSLFLLTVDDTDYKNMWRRPVTICTKRTRELLWSCVAAAKKYVTLDVYTGDGADVYVTAKKGRKK